ncbi:adenylylsulfate kinase [Mucilaginibacter frigoritolerans]|uniref:Adenylyl-sulfate kinase n=1 Tax=Mucilaginibacter frigoritolerans TaxID=652788 RepID=A0A562TL31_9SPHI|nr:adenylyl-sulfate kinase [Mucilaginibacter frigoritolerans]TWI94202.1 adenylylsulfate kinase [Mucilaginibacter frigoritolerans]
MIIQLCGMSGVGKSTITDLVKKRLIKNGYQIEVIDGDEYRKALCKDLGFSKEDRNENINRLSFVASKLSAYGIIVIISAINPYDEVRRKVARSYQNVKTVFIDCPVNELIKRDTKGLYNKALLPDGHPDKIYNLTGINDAFDRPENPDLYINTAGQAVKDCTDKLYDFIADCWSKICSKYD